MTTVSVQLNEGQTPTPRFHAVAGIYQASGNTAGEALDALLEQENGNIDSSAIFIRRAVPDTNFTQAQHDRMQELLARRSSLTTEEDLERDALIDAELE